MKTCSLNEFTEALGPWLEKNYLRGIIFKETGEVVFHFVDGVRDAYQVEDCSMEQLKDVARKLKSKGVLVEGL